MAEMANGGNGEERYGQETHQGFSHRRGAQGPRLEEAIDDAWSKAKRRDPGRDQVRVVEIVAFGSNPINVYRVTVA